MCGFELAHNLDMPQLGRDDTDWPPTMEHNWWEQVWHCRGLPGSEANNKLVADIPRLRNELEMRMQTTTSGSRSNNKVGGRTNKKRRRNNKVQQIFLLTLLPVGRGRGATWHAQQGGGRIREGGGGQHRNRQLQHTTCRATEFSQQQHRLPWTWMTTSSRSRTQ